MFNLFKKNKDATEKTHTIVRHVNPTTEPDWDKERKKDADHFMGSVIEGIISDLENGFVFYDESGRERSDEDFVGACSHAANYNSVWSAILNEDHIWHTNKLETLRDYPLPTPKERDKIRQYIKENWLRGYLEESFRPDASIVGDFLAEAMDWSKGHIREGVRQNGYIKDETYIEEFAADDRLYSKEYLVCQTDYDNLWLRTADTWFLSIALYNYLRSIGMIPILTSGGYSTQAREWITSHTKNFVVYDDDGTVLVSDYRIPISKKDEIMQKNPEFHMNRQVFKEG